MQGCFVWCGIMVVLFILATLTGGGGFFGTALGLMIGISLPIVIGIIGSAITGKLKD